MDNLYHQVGIKKQMLDKNSKEYKQYQCSTNCHICEEEIINTMSQKEFLTWGRPEEDAEDDFVREGDTKTARSKEEELHLRVLKFLTIAIGLENTEDLLILHVIFN